MFQFLLGTLITMQLKPYGQCGKTVSIPLRYADNARTTFQQVDVIAFQFLLGTLITKVPQRIMAVTNRCFNSS